MAVLYPCQWCGQDTSPYGAYGHACTPEGRAHREQAMQPPGDTMTETPAPWEVSHDMVTQKCSVWTRTPSGIQTIAENVDTPQHARQIAALPLWLAVRERLEQRCATLRAALAQYAEHVYPCEARSPLYAEHCTCGLLAALTPPAPPETGG